MLALASRTDDPSVLTTPSTMPSTMPSTRPSTTFPTTCPASGTAADPDGTLPCWTADPDLWFAESPADVERAKALCGPCPLREACLSGALDRREPWGVWGGELVVMGVVVPRKRPRGRPRKDAAA